LFCGGRRLRLRLAEDVLGQAGDHHLRPGRHPPDAAVPVDDGGPAGAQLPAAVREAVRRGGPEAAVPLHEPGAGAGHALPGDRAGVHLLGGGAVPPPGELEPAGGLVLLLHLAGDDRLRGPAAGAERRGGVAVRLLGLHPDGDGAGGDVLQPGAGRGDRPAALHRRRLHPKQAAEGARRGGGVLTEAADRGRRTRQAGPRRQQDPADAAAQQPPQEEQLPQERPGEAVGGGGAPDRVLRAEERQRVRPVDGDGGHPHLRQLPPADGQGAEEGGQQAEGEDGHVRGRNGRQDEQGSRTPGRVHVTKGITIS
jgi:hypothetical protein